MATTAKGTPYVESSDLVANYPAVSLALAEHIDDFGGKVLQVVRATDTTFRSTTSTSFVDANLSVTITPQKSTSAVLLICSVLMSRDGGNDDAILQLTDSSNNAISGAESNVIYENSSSLLRIGQTIFGYATPATTSAVTFKARFRSGNVAVTAQLNNNQKTGQLYAIEVSA